MIDLHLGADEGILLEANLVTWITDNRTTLDSLILTNKNIYCVKKKGLGIISKPEMDITVRPLSDIKQLDGQLLVNKVWDDTNGFVLQIQYVDGIEKYSFDEITGRVATKWNNEIHRLLTGTVAPPNQGDTVTNTIDALSGFAASLKKTAGSAMQTASEAAKQVANGATASVGTVVEQYQERQTEKQATVQSGAVEAGRSSSGAKFCSNCGTKLEAGARFCPGCGTKVGSAAPSVPDVPVQTQNPAERMQEYAGVVLKCPNCGQPISHADVVCPGCGYQIIGRAASSSVQQLQNQLMAIENSRSRNTALRSIITSVTGDDKAESDIATKKITLIKSFPIPNTIEEITEFVILAAGNIDVNLSKVSLGNKWGRIGNDFKANERGISDAWVGKLQQAYQKAELSFSDIPIFAKVKEIYTKKMSELNMLNR